MATTNVDVSADEVAAHPTLTANTVEVVNFTRTASALPLHTPNPLAVVEVVNRGADVVWYTVDGTAPTVGGKRSYVLPVGAADVRDVPSRTVNEVRLLSTGAPPVSVQRVS